MLTNASAHSASTYDYSDYGETRQTSGSTTLNNPFLYTGQEYDFETSLYHLRARHYSPANGRFFSRDPIGYAGGSNMYAYCGGDPIDFSDPSGLYAEVNSRLNRDTGILDVMITLPIEYCGAGATADTVLKFNEQIQRVWTLQLDGYNVTTIVTTPGADTPANKKNRILVYSKNLSGISPHPT